MKRRVLSSVYGESLEVLWEKNSIACVGKTKLFRCYELEQKKYQPVPLLL